jgi:hypothetical protein
MSTGLWTPWVMDLTTLLYGERMNKYIQGKTKMSYQGHVGEIISSSYK